MFIALEVLCSEKKPSERKAADMPLPGHQQVLDIANNTIEQVAPPDTCFCSLLGTARLR